MNVMRVDIVPIGGFGEVIEFRYKGIDVKGALTMYGLNF